MNKNNQHYNQSDQEDGDDDIIENDDYEEESIEQKDNEKEMIFFENEHEKLELIEAHFDKEDKVIELLVDIDIELPNDSMFLPIKKILSDEDDDKYMKRIEELVKDNQRLKDDNERTKLEQTELKVKKETNDKKNEDNVEEKEKNEKCLFEKEKSDLEEKMEQRQNDEKILINSNKEIQLSIDNYLKEFNLLREEMTLKSNMILDKQKRLLQLDKEVFVHGAQTATNVNITAKRNDTINQIKSRTTSVMTQLTKANSQIAKLLQENDLLKERIDLLNQRPVTAVISSPTKDNKNYDDDDHIDINEEITPKSSNNSISNQSNTKTVGNTSNRKINHRAIISEGNTLSTNSTNTLSNKKSLNAITTTMTVFPCQQEMVKRERKILEIESILYKLQKERDILNDNLLKLPEFPKQKAQINEKRALELSISEFNTKINIQKQQLRELNKVS